jgi:hypothetical protein
VKLLDFGVAKLMEGAGKSDQSQLALTQAGTVFGTPEFMSPEQACGHSLDGRSDLYSLGGTLFAMLTGCALYEAGSAIEWLTHHVRTPPPHLADLRPELVAYPELDELLQRCLAKHRDQRPRTAREMESLLSAIEPSLSRPPGAAPSSSSKVRVFSTSMFFEALPMETVDPGATILPSSSSATTSDQRARARSSGDVAAVRPRRRGLYLGLGALAVLGMISVAIGVAVSKRGSRSPSITSDGGAVAEAPPRDAPPVVDVAAHVDAPPAQATPFDAAGSAHPIPIPRNNPVALEHLRKAEDALRANNNFKQLTEADLAHQADPRNPRAKYLLGDALIKYNNLDKGCAYLRELGRNPLAQSRASAAGCP